LSMVFFCPYDDSRASFSVAPHAPRLSPFLGASSLHHPLR
jgi:hypothetical protein